MAVASRAPAAEPLPVIRTTRACGCSAEKRLSTSYPSAFSITTSQKTSSKSASSSRSNACSADAALVTVQFSSRRISATKFLIWGSSSTTSAFVGCFISNQCPELYTPHMVYVDNRSSIRHLRVNPKILQSKEPLPQPAAVEQPGIVEAFIRRRYLI